MSLCGKGHSRGGGGLPLSGLPEWPGPGAGDSAQGPSQGYGPPGPGPHQQPGSSLPRGPGTWGHPRGHAQGTHPAHPRRVLVRRRVSRICPSPIPKCLSYKMAECGPGWLGWERGPERSGCANRAHTLHTGIPVCARPGVPGQRAWEDGRPLPGPAPAGPSWVSAEPQLYGGHQAHSSPSHHQLQRGVGLGGGEVWVAGKDREGASPRGRVRGGGGGGGR